LKGKTLMLHFFKRGTRFGRALIFTALLLLVGIVFSVMSPFSNQPGLLGGSDAAGQVTIIGQSPSANVPDNVPPPACKADGGPCMVTGNTVSVPDNAPPACKVYCTVATNDVGAVIVAPGKMPPNVRYIRKVRPGPFGGMPWSPFVNAFFALWVICAIIGCYILVQETLDLVTNHFRSRPESPPPPQG
jgi:hypothetical protein